MPPSVLGTDLLPGGSPTRAGCSPTARGVGRFDCSGQLRGDDHPQLFRAARGLTDLFHRFSLTLIVMDGSRTVVKCSGGGYYETIWVPLVSLKAIRLGAKRFQRCPIHRKWEMTQRVRDDELTPQIRQAAAQYRDSGVV